MMCVNACGQGLNPLEILSLLDQFVRNITCKENIRLLNKVSNFLLLCHRMNGLA